METTLVDGIPHPLHVAPQALRSMWQWTCSGAEGLLGSAGVIARVERRWVNLASLARKLCVSFVAATQHPELKSFGGMRIDV